MSYAFDALKASKNPALIEYLDIKESDTVAGQSLVSFPMQSAPIGDVGLNGLQATDILEWLIGLYKALDASFPCEENKLTISHLEEAHFAQACRTMRRQKAKIEGTYAEV